MTDATLNKKRPSLFVWAAMFILLMPGLCWSITQPGLMSLMQGIVFPISLLAGYFAIFGRCSWVGIFLLSPFIILAPAEATYVILYGHPSEYYIIAILAESNLREIRDFLGAGLLPMAILLACSAIIAIQATITARRSDVGIQVNGWIRLLVLVAPIVFFAYKNSNSENSGLVETRSSQNAELVNHDNNFVFGYPFGVAQRIYVYFLDRASIRERVLRLDGFRFGASAKHAYHRRQIYVLVVGESSRRDHWQIFGYERATNPELIGLDNLVPLPNVVTPWTFSLFAIPTILTPTTEAKDPSELRTASILRLFSEAGFKTQWISNQLAIGDHDSPISVFAYEADHAQFLNPASWSDPGTYDGVLLPAMQNAITQTSGNIFVVLHTMGSHSNYAYRYPKVFDRFQPSSKANPQSVSNAELLNAYDNSILYTDHFLAEVIHALNSANASSVMIYVSDHGEGLATEACGMSEHGHASLSNYIIPGLVWYSADYAQEFPDKVRNLIHNSKQPLSNENIFDTLVDVGDIDLPSHDATRSILSPDFTIHPRWVNASIKIDIDKAHFVGNCQTISP